jgi:hypothetical protein
VQEYRQHSRFTMVFRMAILLHAARGERITMYEDEGFPMS